LDQSVKCRLRGVNDVGAHLSGGLDSSAVAATAARLLAPSGGRVIAFTAVPREGYDGPVPRHRFADEGHHAAATAALYPNMEHVLVRSEGKSRLISSIGISRSLTSRSSTTAIFYGATRSSIWRGIENSPLSSMAEWAIWD